MADQDSVWVPINLSQWPDPEEGVWARTLAAAEQLHGERRIQYAQEAEDEAFEEGGS